MGRGGRLPAHARAGRGRHRGASALSAPARPLDVAYFAYWSLRDPLTQSQVLPVVLALSARGYRIGLVTWEQAAHAVPDSERAAVAAALADEGVDWQPLDYHARPAVLATAYDAARGLARGLRLAGRGVRLFHSRGTVPAAPAWAAALLRRRLFLYDADGPLSEEYADAGVFGRNSLPHRLTRACERIFARSADRMIVLTRSRAMAVEAEGARTVEVLPCAVDTKRFTFDAEARENTRARLGLSGTVLVYAGKWGGWYAVPEMFDFVASARRRLADLRLLVLTRDDPAPFRAAAAERDLGDVLSVRAAARDEMPALLSAADAGLSFVTPFPSKAASSPVKNGEYLSCGLPVVTTAGIGDYSSLVARERVGVVVPEFALSHYAEAAAALYGLLRDPDVRARCRAIARREVGLEEVVLPRYVQIYADLLGAPVAAGAGTP